MVGSGNGKGEPDVARPCCPGGLCQWSMFTMMLMTNLDLGYSVYRLLGPPVSSSSSLFPFCLRMRNCHGVAGLPFRVTHRFAPQAESSMSSRHGRRRAPIAFPRPRAGGRSSPQLVPSPVPAGLFPPGRRAEKGPGVLRARVTDPSVSLVQGGYPVWQGWCVGWSRLLIPGARLGWGRTSRRRSGMPGASPSGRPA